VAVHTRTNVRKSNGTIVIDTFRKSSVDSAGLRSIDVSRFCAIRIIGVASINAEDMCGMLETSPAAALTSNTSLSRPPLANISFLEGAGKTPSPAGNVFSLVSVASVADALTWAPSPPSPAEASAAAHSWPSAPPSVPRPPQIAPS